MAEATVWRPSLKLSLLIIRAVETPGQIKPRSSTFKRSQPAIYCFAYVTEAKIFQAKLSLGNG